ncbi:MAG: 50S ribosomal protein L28 [Thermoflexales bacterium]|nr:50S ribosomal protein L28 [Thermoflexales bacterium]
MAKCYFTGKAKSFGNNRSHALNATGRTWKANLQRRRMMIDGRMQTVNVSAKALRTLAKTSGK